MNAATRELRLEWRKPTHRSTSGVMPASPSTSSTIAWCWPLDTTTGVSDPLSRSARMSGTSLIASGRVPTTTMTRKVGPLMPGTIPRPRCAVITRVG